MKAILSKLLAVQKEIKPIEKDAMNPHFKNRYFDINSLLAVVKPILNAHGLVLLQPLVGDTLKTIITDVESTESIESSAILPQVSDPQKVGSAISYYRRYLLVSLLGLEGEDDDGNAAASQASPNAPQSSVAPKAVQSTTQEICKDCGSAMIPGKNGKPYCKPCYVKWAEAKKAAELPVIQQDNPVTPRGDTLVIGEDGIPLDQIPF